MPTDDNRGNRRAFLTTVLSLNCVRRGSREEMKPGWRGCLTTISHPRRASQPFGPNRRAKRLPSFA
jgi:hypothetical protein